MNDLKDHARKNFVSLFMDGRNEAGTHLLEMSHNGIAPMALRRLIDTELRPDDGTAEFIFSEAEAVGYKDSDCIVTLWEYMPEDDSSWEYVGISDVLTDLFWGNFNVN